MIALLLMLFALFGFSTGSSSVSAGPTAPTQPPRAPVTQPALAPAPRSCVTVHFYRAGTPRGPLQTPCNARSGAKR